ncbi:glycosyltransferase family 2 protein [Gloeobacter morelensis]|uniref:Glycosyltransferase family 2 protein n=1 Tax=Gloeobacter morelensis MG652769 TaxID=2781736 RepID=A0ABY3PHL2_9CYAN|nr:glycosyltransferase family 2 protein [Gloeobacter morelensis]UFP93113.1 glycosyltransferase family 2 protein [Gloeobacter morelensis MG652769]
MPQSISVVVPVFNEQDNLPELYRRLTAVLGGLGSSYEIIFVDDASSDRTPHLVRQFIQADPRVRLLSFSRNFGHQVAVTAGLNFTGSEAVVIMDGDLQDPPELLPQLLDKWRAGFKVVFARRTQRGREPASKRLFAFLYYRLLQRLAEVQMPVDSGDFCLLDRQIVDLLNAMPERNRYLRGLRSWVGFDQAEVTFERPARLAGEPKYTFTKSLALALDGLVSFSRLPLRLATWLGFFTGFLALVMVGLVIYWRFFTASPLNGFGALAAAVFFIGAVQLITVGILGEYVGRIYEEIKNRPLYILKDAQGFERPVPGRVGKAPFSNGP